MAMQKLTTVQFSVDGYAIHHVRALDNQFWQKRRNQYRSNLYGSLLQSGKNDTKLTKRTEKRTCRSELFHDAPFVIAIGACVFNSLLLQEKDEEQPTGAPLGEDDVRNGAVTIISFIPLFNWLGWIFLWMDTNDQRYLFYAFAYLAPYARTGFSFASNENWLVLLGYLTCIMHTQLEIQSQTGVKEHVNDFLQDYLRLFQKKVKLWLPQKTSKTIDETFSSMADDADPDFSRIDLLEFDKKLADIRKHKEALDRPDDANQFSETEN
ncbi:hypothetical protein KP509_29G041100 [Ceratopteris richardii]|uniref:Uncharacterized protein n=1 Tax=Ceratopteris richardii TaxID=49495 RepID=A0A8T2R840_CERRI|nr:hypothetical protein KP509_29G041100 [Ceratopteris richardii]